MNCIPLPLLGTQRIRLRKQLHFGEHNPSLCPQPFNIHTAHLTLIQFPGPSEFVSDILWRTPGGDEFELITGHTLSNFPLGRIPSKYLMLLEAEYNTLPAHSNIIADLKIRDYCCTIRQMLDRLASPATFTEALMTWCLAQQNCLELEARILWVTEVQPQSLRLQSWEVQPVHNVVGAITENFSVADRLYCVRSLHSLNLLLCYLCFGC